jgi:hypothetical protein
MQVYPPRLVGFTATEGSTFTLLGIAVIMSRGLAAQQADKGAASTVTWSSEDGLDRR